jgi:hypothetical protein
MPPQFRPGIFMAVKVENDAAARSRLNLKLDTMIKICPFLFV